jgi:hypothetical protein
MTSAIDKNCTFLILNERSSSVSQEDICKDLESSDVQNKIRLVMSLLPAPSHILSKCISVVHSIHPSILMQRSQECDHGFVGQREHAQSPHDGHQVLLCSPALNKITKIIILSDFVLLKMIIN